MAACGDALQEFRDDLRPLEQRAEEQRARISAELRAARTGADPVGLRADIAQLAQTYEEIRELEAPEEYEEPFAAYVAANTRMVANLERYADRLATGEPAALRAAAAKVVADLARSENARLRWLE